MGSFGSKRSYESEMRSHQRVLVHEGAKQVAEVILAVDYLADQEDAAQVNFTG